MTEPFDAVLAEMRVAKFLVPASALREYHDRLAAAHAAEVAERDAAIGAAESSRAADVAELSERADRAMGLLREASPFVRTRSGGEKLIERIDAFLAEQAQVGGENGNVV